MKQLHKPYSFCAILLAALLLSACGRASGSNHRDPPIPGPTETYTNSEIGFAIDYPADWHARTGQSLILTSFKPAETGQGGISAGESKIDLLPPASPRLNQPLDEMVEQVKRASEILWEENWILPGNVPAVRLQTKSEMSGEVAVLLTRINDTSLWVGGWLRRSDTIRRHRAHTAPCVLDGDRREQSK